MTGLRPVAEIEFGDFLTCCMDPIINQMAKLRFMTGGQVDLPLVFRTNTGSGFSAGAQHSQSLEALLMHVPGLVIAVPVATGYGVAANGITALNSALASCAPGLVVVNVDNGYGAGCAALRMLNVMQRRSGHSDGSG